MNSLREVCLGLAGCESPLKNLGISTAPKKSTLAYANANRPWELNIFMLDQDVDFLRAKVYVGAPDAREEVFLKSVSCLKRSRMRLECSRLLRMRNSSRGQV